MVHQRKSSMRLLSVRNRGRGNEQAPVQGVQFIHTSVGNYPVGEGANNDDTLTALPFLNTTNLRYPLTLPSTLL